MKNILTKYNTDLAGCRYADCLEVLLNKLEAKKILKADWECDYQGHVDVDVLLKDGRVFSLYYSYGSCSGCDEWEDRDLTDKEIQKEMSKDATIFRSIETYKRFDEKRPSRK